MNSKKKGNKGEHAFAHFLENNGFKAMRNAMSGGGIWKGDIGNDINFCFEVKTAKAVNLRKTWMQVNRDSSQSHATPCVAIHLDGMPESEWLIVMHSNDWVESIKHPISSSRIDSGGTKSRELRYATDFAIRALKSLLKLLTQEEG